MPSSGGRGAASLRIAVLGAAGAMAQVVVRDLLEFVPDVAITAADQRPFVHGDPRVRPASLDARDEAATARLLEGHDAVLNCVTYYFNVPVMRAALAARVPYADLGGLYHGSVKQFALHEEFVRAGVPALLGMGSTPGITNVMAGVLARGLDAVEEVHVRVGCIDRSASGPLPVPYALDTVLDEFALEPIVFREGRAETVPPMSGRETIEFPEPVGRAEALYTLHSEVAMFPRSFPTLRSASFKVAFEPAFVEKMRFLVELGFASREKLGESLSPRETLLALAARQTAPGGEPRDCDALRVDLAGRQNGRRIERRVEMVVLPHPDWRVAAGSLDTGVPLSIAGQLLGSGAIRTPGVLCPETAVPGETFFKMLERRGMRARWS
ncbi:MAG TPA: saccharopine dehydrogenase C-terminal domain-containing protein [Thermoanaerobaculia bacterium]|nr:saccharopine dehydrogenase C-terminal domain-containing protein [Thermoanaerobaculia bacterium]